MNTNFIFHLSDDLKTSGIHQHHCRLSSLRRQQHFFQPRRTDGYYKVRPGDTLTQIRQTLRTKRQYTGCMEQPSQRLLKSKLAKYCASAVMLPPQYCYAATPSNRRYPNQPVKLQWPTDNASSSIIQSYNGTTSKGIDIAGTQGQQIRSAAAGTVIYVGEGSAATAS